MEDQLYPESFFVQVGVFMAYAKILKKLLSVLWIHGGFPSFHRCRTQVERRTQHLLDSGGLTLAIRFSVLVFQGQIPFERWLILLGFHRFPRIPTFSVWILMFYPILWCFISRRFSWTILSPHIWPISLCEVNLRSQRRPRLWKIGFASSIRWDFLLWLIASEMDRNGGFKLGFLGMEDPKNSQK